MTEDPFSHLLSHPKLYTMTFFILAEVATYSYEGDVVDVEYDVYIIEAETELSAKESLRTLIYNSGRMVGKMTIEDVCQENLSDVLN